MAPLNNALFWKKTFIPHVFKQTLIRFGWVAAFLLWAMPLAQADSSPVPNCVELSHLTLLPLPMNSNGDSTVLIEADADQPIGMETQANGAFSSLRLKNACLKPTWVTTQHQLIPAVFVHVPPYPVQVVQSGTDTDLIFQSKTPVVLSVLPTAAAFQSEAVEAIPLYGQWPKASLIAKPVSKSIGKAAQTPQQQLMLQAQKAIQANQLGLAADKLQTLLRTTPNPPLATYALLSAIYLKQQAWVRALVFYSEYAKTHPAQLGIRYGSLLYQLQQRDKAVQVLTDMLTTPTPPLPANTAAQAHFMLGNMLVEAHHYDEALPHLTASLQTFAESPIVHYDLAIAYEGQHQPQQALEEYKNALKLSRGPLTTDIQTQITRLESPAP